MTRQDLLDKVVEDLEVNGIGDRSLRDIAAGVGTSHRMLIHHFGSRQGLLTEVVRRVEAEQRAFFTSVDVPPEELSLVMWNRLRDPAVWPAERLFFECYARAARGEPPYASLLPGLVDDWLDASAPADPADPSTAGRPGRGAAGARAVPGAPAGPGRNGGPGGRRRGVRGLSAARGDREDGGLTFKSLHGLGSCGLAIQQESRP